MIMDNFLIKQNINYPCHFYSAKKPYKDIERTVKFFVFLNWNLYIFFVSLFLRPIQQINYPINMIFSSVYNERKICYFYFIAIYSSSLIFMTVYFHIHSRAQKNNKISLKGNKSESMIVIFSFLSLIVFFYYVADTGNVSL